jgi:hypothetical protein
VDPGVEDEDIVMVGRVLDRMPDEAFASYGRTGAAIDELCRQFTAWPR